MPALRQSDSLMDILDDYRSTWQALSDANIALYPVDMHGLMTTSMPDASYADQTRSGNSQAALGKFENQKQNRNEDNINTMTTFANETGGKAFYNDNDLVTGFKQAVNDYALTPTCLATTSARGRHAGLAQAACRRRPQRRAHARPHRIPGEESRRGAS